MSGAVLFHVQHLLGIGHLQRTLRIADAVAREGIDVTVVSGGMPVDLPRHAAIRFVQLPPVRARDTSFALIDAAGVPPGDTLREERRSKLLQAFAAARPDVVVVEGFPFARRAFRFELDPLIAAAKAAGAPARIVCSLRDILVQRDDPQRQQDIVRRVRHDFDAVLVHGDPAFIPLDASFPAVPEIADKLVYTGYVSLRAKAEEPPAKDGTDEVIVSAGGGAAGKALLEAAIEAGRSGCLGDSAWRLVTGVNLPAADFAALAAAAPSGALIERFRADLPQMLRRCRVSVSQAGYNTVLDILAAGARAVLVPFEAERETEQRLRADRLAALGVAELVPAAKLTPARLAAAIERAAARPPMQLTIDRDGAVRSARMIAAMTRGRSFFDHGLVAAARRDILVR